MDESIVEHLEQDMVSKVLLRAAQIMTERGLFKGDLVGGNPHRGPVCFQGAIIAALCGGNAGEHMSGDNQDIFMLANRRAERLLHRDTAEWNDRDERTQAEVVALLIFAAGACPHADR